MKNLTNRFVSFMLVFALALSLSAPAFAAEYSGTNELNNEVGTIDALEEIDFFVVEQEETSEDVLREIYANLAPEAKEKALQVIASNPDLLSYYVEEIDPTFSADQAMCGSNGIFRVGARANDPTKNIERRLTALGVPSAVILAAVAAATSLVYAAADGPLLFGDAYALFTDTFWSTCNDDGNAPIYIEHDGRLFILDCAYGDQYYNSNIPDEFTLTAQTDDRIDFTVTAHYSYPYPRQDETEAERDERLKTSYEYTRIYPVTLIYTDAGWRFDAFTTPNQADMQLIGEWDGVEETDFYNVRISLSAAELPVSK